MREPALGILLVLVSLLACGEGSGAPGGPTQPLPPGPDANIVAASNVTIGLCSPPGCAYSIAYRNNGGGCANSIHGKIRAYEGDSLLETDDWWLDSTEILSPGETVSVDDCCFGPDTVQRRTRFSSEVFWNNVRCN